MLISLCAFSIVSLTGCATWNKLFGGNKAEFQEPMASANDYGTSMDRYEEPAQQATDVASRYEETPRSYDPYPTYGSQTTPTAVPLTSTNTRYHTVTKSDTLYKLARTYYHDAARWKDIYKANPEISDPNRIFVGQKILIP